MRVCLFWMLVLPLIAADDVLTADAIMARVAANQDRALLARASYVYHQNVAIRLRDTYGKLVREEISDFLVTPGSGHNARQLTHFTGRYEERGAMVAYKESGDEGTGGFRTEADGNMAKNFCKNMTGSEKSRDGLDPNLFPLTAKEQLKYQFHLKGEETYRGTLAYRVAFEPKKGVPEKNHEEGDWKGEALISKSDFEPLTISTKLASGIPFLVRTALGTSLPGLGFSVSYQKFDEGVWFPVSYGTEFHVRILFVYSRHVAISMSNTEFRRTDVKSSVEFEPVQ